MRRSMRALPACGAMASTSSTRSICASSSSHVCASSAAITSSGGSISYRRASFLPTTQRSVNALKSANGYHNILRTPRIASSCNSRFLNVRGDATLAGKETLLATETESELEQGKSLETPQKIRGYPFPEIEARWQQYWEENQTFRTPDVVDTTKPKYYVLDMFPYPSGAGLHVGHPEGYTATDIMARYKRMRGFNVLHPMGWDAFGLPAEQYAIETGTHPRVTTLKNIDRFRSQVEYTVFKDTRDGSHVSADAVDGSDYYSPSKHSLPFRSWIDSLKSLHHGRWQWDSFRSMSTLLPNTAFPSNEHPNSNPNFSSQGALTHATSAKVKFLGVFIGFVDNAKRKRQYDKALEKRRRVIHRLLQLQKQRQESWKKDVERLAFNAFTRAYRKTLNTLRSGSKAKQAIFDKASELGTKSALTLADQHPLMTSDDLKKLLEQEEDHFGRLGWEYLPVSVKTAYENLMLSIDEACKELKTQIAESRPAKLSSNRIFSDTEIALSNLHTASSDDERTESDLVDLNYSFENVMERVADPETLSAAYDRIKSKLQLLSGKSSEDWNDLNMSFFDHIAHKLRTGTYQFSPVSQIYVRKPGKDEARRTIVVVNPRDQVVAEAVRAELERMYEPVFYKLARSCHMALKLVKRTWKGTTWFIHYKSPIAFGKLHHENLLYILSVRVKDEEFLCLIQKMFKTSVINLGDRGSQLSALLCNIYYHQLDMEVTRIQAELNTGSNKRKMRSSVQLDEETEAKPYARVRYVRYAEEILFGITGSKAMALEVSERVQTFLRRELKLRRP